MSIAVKNIQSGEIFLWTLTEVLEEVNRDHSDEFTPFDESDWQSGWDEWVAESGFYTLIEIHS